MAVIGAYTAFSQYKSPPPPLTESAKALKVEIPEDLTSFLEDRHITEDDLRRVIDQAELPHETLVKFSIVLADGSKPIRAEGKVSRYVPPTGDRPGGLKVRFRRFDSACMDPMQGSFFKEKNSKTSFTAWSKAEATNAAARCGVRDISVRRWGLATRSPWCATGTKPWFAPSTFRPCPRS